jgi:cytochrome c-type biogenesis protein CcmH
MTSLKRWPGWAVLAAVVVIALVIGSVRGSGPQTDDDRVDTITQRLACPECTGESVFESRSPISDTIRRQVRALVQQGQYDDDQIVDYIVDRFTARALLVPKSSGFDSLVWIVPVFAGICAVAGLGVAFRRWRLAADTVPSDDDRELVAAALAREHEQQ